MEEERAVEVAGGEAVLDGMEAEAAFWKRAWAPEGVGVGVGVSVGVSVGGWRCAARRGGLEGPIRGCGSETGEGSEDEASDFMSPLLGACPPWRGRFLCGLSYIYSATQRSAVGRALAGRRKAKQRNGAQRLLVMRDEMCCCSTYARRM